MKTLPRLLALLFLFALCSLAEAQLAASNVRPAQRAGSKLVDIDYDVTGTTSPVTVALQISADGGSTWAVPATTLSGAIGTGVTPASNLRITWNAGTDWNQRLSSQVKFRLSVTEAAAAPTGFSLIPSGSFTMGDALGESIFDAPRHTVNVSAFYMAQNLVTKAQWDTVRTWAISNGYSDLAAGAGKASTHPVQTISWCDGVKYCNARSQQEGLTPVYYTNDAQTTVYKTGKVNVTNAQVKWSANGYRLPTEAEWEKAARGGLSSKRFPWGDTISHSQANYYSRVYYNPYDLSSAVEGFHPTYATGNYPYTSPVGSFAANGYGLNDVAGNIWQWCWDWYDNYDTDSQSDPRGVSSGARRVIRGGGWGGSSESCRVADRFSTYPNNLGADPSGMDISVGFRVVRSSVAESAETAPAIAAQPLSVTVSSGNTTTLSVVAGGTALLTYQWYQGAVGTTTNPVGTNSASFTTPSLTVTTTYWVRVSNATGNVSSALATVTVQANTAPTISDIAAQSITAVDNTGALAFTIGDAQTAASSLTLSASSSNTTLVPNASIVFGGSEASRTVTVTPASIQSGTATITVTVSDGSLTASDTFVLTVQANTAPTISDIADQTITAGSNTGAIAFTIGHDQTAASSLTLSGSSSNTTLVPNASIVFGGSGASRTVTVTPVSGQTGSATITVTVSDGSLSASDAFVLTVNSVAPTGFALIPSGSFTMGEALDGIGGDAHTVTVSAFYMAKNLVTKADWDMVRTWAISSGYTDLAAGSGKASTHPVQTISWYEMVKFCNARSQKEGLTPVYYTNDAQTEVYKRGNVNVTNAQVKWTANGYRLPTEAEWEKAARGGLSGKRFPWGDTISHSQANYYANGSGPSWDLSKAEDDFHPTYAAGAVTGVDPTATGADPYTSPVESFAANGYGLNDMAGNVWQRCWDLYGMYDTHSPTDPRGASSGSGRVFRGGCWCYRAGSCRVAYRNYDGPWITFNYIGFRVARSSVQ